MPGNKEHMIMSPNRNAFLRWSALVIIFREGCQKHIAKVDQ